MFNNLKNKEQEELLPEHIGIIMDGNGRWAKQKGNHESLDTKQEWIR